MLHLHSRASRIAVHALLAVLAVAFCWPLVAMAQVSFQGEGALANYTAVFAQPLLPDFLRNSLLIAAGAVVISFLATMLAAFALAKLPVLGGEFVFILLLASLTLPTVALLVPLFVTMTQFGLFNTYWAVIIPVAALTIPFNVLLARGFIAELPKEIFEAAELDGCDSVRTFLHLLLPLVRPLSAVVVVTTFLAAWNEYLLPLLFLQDPSKQTVTLLPSFFASQYGSDQGKIIAASVLIAVPTILVYVVAQRFFDVAFTSGAVK